MRNLKHFTRLGLGLALLLAALACRSAAPANTPEPAAPLPTNAPATPAAGEESGWQGKTSLNSAIEFRVAGDEVTYIAVTYTLDSGPCAGSRSFSQKVSAPILDGKFTAEWHSGASQRVRVVGQFFSETVATGMVDLIDPSSEPCKANTQLQWEALSEAAIALGTPVIAPPPFPIAPAP